MIGNSLVVAIEVHVIVVLSSLFIYAYQDESKSSVKPNPNYWLATWQNLKRA